MNYRVEITYFNWINKGEEIYIDFKVNNHLRSMKASYKHLRDYYVDKCKHLGITENNVDDMMNENDPKYSLKDEFLKKYIQYFFTV